MTPRKLSNGKHVCPSCGLSWETSGQAVRCCNGGGEVHTKHEVRSTQIGGDHYARHAIQPWDAMAEWMTPEQFAGFLRGNALKYIAWAGSKGSASEDYRKAKHYLEKLIEVAGDGVARHGSN